MRIIHKNIGIKPCTCRSEFQDAKYGKGLRVMNRTKQASDKLSYRCTICKKEH